ncbi:hypothetical protein FQN50_003558 [Emmonsiellopsis sp. PD_5]|nr:hypothetical protein FQN50_003558 [Emmonsiellopsis sp. PD_5]
MHPKKRRMPNEQGAPRRSARIKDIHRLHEITTPEGRTAVQDQLPLYLESKPPSNRQPNNRKRERLQETKDSPCLDSKPSQKRLRTSPACPAIAKLPIEGALAQQTAQYSKTWFTDYWRKEGVWPREFFEGGINMTSPFARKRSTPSPRRKQSASTVTSSTPSDQKPSQDKSAQYKDPRYEILLETKGCYMGESNQGITDASESWCKTLLNAPQNIPKDSLFRDDLFKATCEKVRPRNEAIVVQDIARLIVPSAENLAIFGDTHLNPLIESVNEGWDNTIAITKPRPQPDYSVGFKRSAFTNEQLQKLYPFVGDLMDTSYFMATYYMYFPFLTCEVKCGAAALDIADRQNSHSATIAVRAVVELFKLVKREKEIDREILAFSISHDHRTVRIYGHYAVIGGATTFYRHPIHTFDFVALDGKEKWTAYRFTRNIYDSWMPTHFQRLCSAIDQIPPNVNFTVPQSARQLSQHPLGERDSRPSLDSVTSASIVDTASSTDQAQAFKKPRKN